MILRFWTVLATIVAALSPLVIADDVFCGQLMIHKQQWLARAASTISSQTTADLKECINICCSIPNCNAVTFMGFISNTSQEATSVNCLMFSCEGKCVVVDRPSAAEGVVSVVINKTSTETRATAEAQGTPINAPDTTEGVFLPSSSNEGPSTMAPDSIPITFPRPPDMLSGDNNGNIVTESMPSASPNNTYNGTVSSHRTNSSTISSTHIFLSKYTPIWAVGIAIVVAVVCIGVNVVLVSAFCCYKRHKNRMRSETFTPHIKAPTLHAFNPST
uniref:MANEC domain-containing protein n=1 Tax=Panagrellus redivivus TaxID=6233 RepID=A0A7E4VTM2_PANRE